jgi:hypothetical protein
MPFDGYDLPTLRAMVLAGERPAMGLSCPGAVQLGLGRIVALHHRSSALCRIH